MTRFETFKAAGVGLLSLAPGPPAGRESSVVSLPQLRFALGIGSEIGVGVLFDEPLLIVQGPSGATKRRYIPRADLRGIAGWQATPSPPQPSFSYVEGPANSDVVHGKVLDRATAICDARNGVYLAMLAFSTPYLVCYDAHRDVFWTRPVAALKPVHVVFGQLSGLGYIEAGSTEVHTIEEPSS